MAKQATKLNNVKKIVKTPDPYKQFTEDIADIILRLDDVDNRLIEVDTQTGKLIEEMAISNFEELLEERALELLGKTLEEV